MSKRKSSLIPPGTKNILVSACLIGENCFYNGRNKQNQFVISLQERFNFIKVCPEVLGGLPTPRPCSEIIGGGGEDVWRHKAKVLNQKGADVTEFFLRGAETALRLAQRYGIKYAIMKSKSPSCGSGLIYDGTFKDRLRPGDGVTVALLKANGIKVITEKELVTLMRKEE